MNIHFEKANLSHINIIFEWLAEPYVQEFWDNTQGHKDDILNFVNGRADPSSYADGKYVYWIANCYGHPFAMLMTIQETIEDPIDDIKLIHLSKTGHTYGIDYMIGDKNYFGKGYGAKTLIDFFEFFRKEFDPEADTFLIDPASDNPRAKHVYMKAGFEHIGDFVMSGDVSGAGKPHHLLIKRFATKQDWVKVINLGIPTQEPERVYGGLLHIMWRLNTNKGSFAIKQLSKDIDLSNERVIKNYELSEHIASRFIAQGIPGVSAIEKDGKFLFIIDGTGFLVYPWVDAKALDEDAISSLQALEIARILAKMHLINLSVPEIEAAQFDVHDNDKIIALVNLAKKLNLIFSSALVENLGTLLEINKKYHDAISILKNHTVISHGDIDPKNVLWDHSKNPILIDWESARKVNPTYEIVNAALDWSGITTQYNKEHFGKIIRAYKAAGGIIDNDALEAAFYAVLGNWINWMVYNIRRAANQQDPEQQKIGTEQVRQVLSTILRLKDLMPELIDMGKL